MKTSLADTSRITGWGVDADRENDPTWPMRDQSREDGPGMAWTRPTLQSQSVEVLQSIEHNRRPAVFGTSTPPQGVSGAIRRVAFRYSESQWAHWLLLMAADRVNVVEGVLQDLGRGRIPNVFAEMGGRAELKHNPRGFYTRMAVSAAVVGVVALGVAALLRARDD